MTPAMAVGTRMSGASTPVPRKLFGGDTDDRHRSVEMHCAADGESDLLEITICAPSLKSRHERHQEHEEHKCSCLSHWRVLCSFQTICFVIFVSFVASFQPQLSSV